MKKFTKLLAATGVSLFGLATVTLPAAAQTSPAPKFSADDSAYCAATFGWILEFLAPNGLPQDAAAQSNIAFMMWNYELNTAMGEADEAAFKTKADAAIQKLASSMPKQEAEQQDLQVIVDYVTSEATVCGKKLEAAYPSGTHPVITALQQKAEAARAARESEPIKLE